MLEHSPHGAPPLVAAPRHLRRRRMHTEIPDTFLVPGAEPIPVSVPPPQPAPADEETANQDAKQDKEAQQLVRDHMNRRKRRVALLAVVFVAIAVPVILLALLFG
ncbi:hypothetical protein AB4089_01840 [Arthrobacter sp. 2MCAF15]|uniref:hypothetical protein n=1 Tax=Arthrobacter sp. 2MCAF15 TaxID=3232984 RepID=UPI003F92452B